MAFGYDPSIEAYGYDPKKAKDLLQQAGYPDGLEITLHTGFGSVWGRQMGEAIAEMLTEVGLRTNLKIWDPGPAWDKFFQGEGKATNGYYGSWGYYSTFDAMPCSIRSTTASPAAGLANGIHAFRVWIN
jgi:ABC-type transport system substrate-binding protein